MQWSSGIVRGRYLILGLGLNSTADVLITFVLPRVNSLVYVAGVIGGCGVTMTAALLTDILSLFTVHMRLCYVLSLTVFAKQLEAAGALWKLFRGTVMHTLDVWRMTNLDSQERGSTSFGGGLTLGSLTLISFFSARSCLHSWHSSIPPR